VRATEALKPTTGRIGLQIYADKTKLMELLNIKMAAGAIETLPYEKVEEFQYLGVLLSTKND